MLLLKLMNIIIFILYWSWPPAAALLIAHWGSRLAEALGMTK